MHVNSRRLGAVSILALLVAGTPVTSFAQTQGEGTGFFTMLGRIVFNTGRARVAIDTPQAVSALEAEDLEAEQADTPGELLRTIPAVQGYGGSITGQYINIRGVGGAHDAADDNRVVVTVDGVEKYYEQYRVGSTFGEPELYRRVEVLRGPAASLLHGSGGIGGVVAFETRDASDFLTDGSNTALRLRATYATNGGYSASAILAQRFNERFELLGALTYRADRNYTTGDGTEVPGNDLDAVSGLISGRFVLNDDASSVLRFSLSRWVSEGDQVRYSAFGNMLDFGFIDRRVTDETAQLTWEYNPADNPFVDARVQLSYANSQVEQENCTLIPARPCSGVWAPSVYSYATTTLSARNTAAWQGNGWENFLTFGASYSERERRHTRLLTTGLTGNNTHPEGDTSGYSLFLQNEFIYDERLTVLAALRYDAQTLTATNGILPVTLLGVGHDQSGLSGSLAAHYRLNEQWSVFGSVADITRLPSIDEFFSQNSAGTSLPSLNLRPERARNVELGFSWEGRDLWASGDALDIKVTGFHNQFRDRIEAVSVQNEPQYQNIGRARLRGVEIEASYQSDLWFGRVAASYIEGENQITNTRLRMVPAPELLLEIGRRLPDQNLEISWRGTFARGTELVRGNPATRFGGYGIHDVNVTWRPDQGLLAGTVVQLGVHNIFDRQYYNILDNVHVGEAGRPPAPNVGFEYTSARRGRDVRLSIGRTFTF